MWFSTELDIRILRRCDDWIQFCKVKCMNIGNYFERIKGGNLGYHLDTVVLYSIGSMMLST